MPTKIIDAQGKEHEFQTKEEIDATIKEKVEASTKELTEANEKTVKELADTHTEVLDKKEEEITNLGKDIETAKQSLKDAAEGTVDWNSARKQIGDLETKLETVNKDREKEKGEFATQIRDVRTSIFKDTVESMLDNLSGGEKDLREKIEFHYNRLNEKVENEKEATEAMKDAYMLATKKNVPDGFNVARGSNAGMPPKTQEPMSKEVTELGRKFGLSDDDVTKFSQIAQDKKPEQPIN